MKSKFLAALILATALIAVFAAYPVHAEQFADAPGLKEVMTRIMQFFAKILAYLGTIAFVVCGIIYITAAGNVERAEAAKRYLKYAVIGLVVSVGSWGIVITINRLLS